MTFLKKILESFSVNSSEIRIPKRRREITNSFYFYRQTTGNYVQTSTDPENRRFILYDEKSKRILCPSHGFWERFCIKDSQLFCSRGCKCTGLPFIFHNDNSLSYNYDAEKEELFDFDKNNVSRDLAVIKIFENYTTGKFNIQIVVINHKRAQNIKITEARNIPRFRKDFSFDIKNNKYSFNYYLNGWGNNTFSCIAEILPENVYAFAAERLRKMIRNYFGKKLDLKYTGSKNRELLAISRFPYEPNLADAVDYTDINIERSEMNGYNKFCENYGIKNYKTLHKIYLEKDIMAVIAYKGLVEAGFKDKNIMNSVYGTPVSKLFYYSDNTFDYYAAVQHFCRRLAAEKSEKSIINFFNKTVSKVKDMNIIHDAIKIFNNYYDEFTQEFKDDVFKDGFTERIHDELVKYDYGKKNKNIVFKYTEKQLQLEDDIDGYSFRLPKESYELLKIGTVLHNCVGTYRDNVLGHYCTIVYAVKNGIYKLCIEVRDGRIWQQRADHNSTPAGEDAVVMKKWQIKHKLNFWGNHF